MPRRCWIRAIALLWFAAGLVACQAESPKVECLSVEAAKAVMADESTGIFFDGLERAEIAALTGAPANGSSIEECRRSALARFQEGVLPFTDREKNALAQVVRQLCKKLEPDYPLFVLHPWKFVKLKEGLAAGFPFSRGPAIVLSERRIVFLTAGQRFLTEEESLRGYGSLFVHEQMHVLQRAYPDRFATLYSDVFGMVRGRVEPNRWITERQMSNPDVAERDWLFPVEKDGATRYFWPRTVLSKIDGVPDMRRHMEELVVPVEKSAKGGYRVMLNSDGVPKTQPVETLSDYLKKFPIVRSLDHPNEMSAYFFDAYFSEKYVRRDPKAPIATSAMGKAFVDWAQKNLREAKTATK